ncbi:aminomethyltransferase beta-barrel domain-containing protein [Acinetobacter baumannii]
MISLSPPTICNSAEFSAPQWAPAVGQSLVLFQENECLGGGVISEIH